MDSEGKCRLDEQMKEPFLFQDGFIRIPDGPGLGIELVEGIETRFPFEGLYGKFYLQDDGSIMDR